MGGTYEGTERRKQAASLDDLRDGIGRIASHLESEDRFRQWVHEKFHDIKDTIFGNGKKGLIREMDAVQTEVGQLRKDFDKMDGRIERVIGWTLVSSISALALILFEVIMMVLRRGHPGP